MAEIITYEALREIQRQERKSEKLYALHENFYDSVKTYFSRKVEDEISATELKNAKAILQDIADRRERKILNLALRGARALEKTDTRSMTLKEKELCTALLDILKNYRTDINYINSESMQREQKKDAPEPKAEELVSYTKVRILEDLPEIIGSDMENYGPFKNGEIIELPKENADIFVEKGKAEIVSNA